LPLINDMTEVTVERSAECFDTRDDDNRVVCGLLALPIHFKEDASMFIKTYPVTTIILS
jgi:hypothetical protein